MTTLGLIPFPLERNAGIGGTDARIIATGKEWHRLYLEKTGQVPPFDSTYIWIMRLGQETEKLHAWWHGSSEGVKVTDPFGDNPTTRPGIPTHHFATFDRMVDDGSKTVPLEMKHRHARTYLREQATEYMAQLQWQMHVAGTDELRFSLIAGNAEPEWGIVARDQAYIDQLIEQTDAFWWHVTEGVAPDPDPEKPAGNAAGLAAAGGRIPLNGFKPYDMEDSNAWAVAAGDWLSTKIAADRHKTANETIRGLIPKDAETCSGHGLSFKRDARGAYRVTIDEEKQAYWTRRFDAMREGKGAG